MFNLLKDSFIYVAHQNMFWGSMGFTTAIAMFIGVILYDGNIEESKKGSISVLSYAAMIFWTTMVRINPPPLESQTHKGMVYAGIATVIYLTIFWLAGIMIGVNFFKHKKFKL